MNVKRIYAALVLTVIAAFPITGSIGQAALAGKSEKKRNDLTGTWLVNVECDCGGASSANGSYSLMSKFPQMNQTASADSTQTVSQAPFNTVETFHSDGTFAEDSLLDYIPPQGPPGRGLWAKTGEGEFSVTHYGVIVGAISDAQLQGTYRVRSKLATNQTGDQFSGIGKIEIFDPSGNLVFSVDAPVTARRATLEPLP